MRCRLFTPLFFRKIIEFERFVLRAAILHDPTPLVHLKIKIPATVRRGISKRSHGKIGDCEQSICVEATSSSFAAKEGNILPIRYTSFSTHCTL